MSRRGYVDFEIGPSTGWHLETCKQIRKYDSVVGQDRQTRLGVSIPGDRKLRPKLPPGSPGRPWIGLDAPGHPQKQKPAASGFSGHYWTALDANENLIGGPGGIRTHYRSIMSRQLIPIKLPALSTKGSLATACSARQSDSHALAKVCEFALKRLSKQARRARNSARRARISVAHPAAQFPSRNDFSLSERLGWRSLRNALASIWRIRSRVTSNCLPTSSSV
jgi:hypothetical protein